MYTVALDSSCTDDYTTIGGKAANLVELAKIPGIKVPRGFCVRGIAFEQAIKGLGIPGSVKSIEDVVAFSRETRAKILAMEMPAEIEREVLERCRDYKEPFAVRSSATLEDSSKYSFAGQQDSFLVVARGDVPEKIRECWASLYNSHALNYRKDVGVDEIGVMSVPVQEMVNARASGVMFTAQLSTGNRDIVVINTAYGLCNTIVSGEVNADVYYIRKPDGKIIRRAIRKKDIMSVMKDGRIETLDISGEDFASKPAIDDSMLMELFRRGLEIEEYFGCPQDTEFSIDSEINFVQARPLQLKKE